MKEPSNGPSVKIASHHEAELRLGEQAGTELEPEKLPPSSSGDVQKSPSKQVIAFAAR